jgi:hypothetical protein
MGYGLDNWDLITGRNTVLGSPPVVWWSQFLATDPEILISIPSTTRFSEK